MHLCRWVEELLSVMDQANMPMRVNSDRTKGMLERAGFVDVAEQVITLPIGRWPKDLEEQQLGRWFAFVLKDWIESYALGPLTKLRHWDKAAVEDLIFRVKEELSPHNFETGEGPRLYCLL